MNPNGDVGIKQSGCRAFEGPQLRNVEVQGKVTVGTRLNIYERKSLIEREKALEY